MKNYFSKNIASSRSERIISKHKNINVLYVFEGILSQWNANFYHCKHDTFKYEKEALEEYAATDSSHEYLGGEIF